MSRHLIPIEGLSLEEGDGHMVDKGEDITIMRMICDSLLSAVNQKMIRQAGNTDKGFRKLMQALQEGHRTRDAKHSPYTRESV